jgi:hypothetical protein
MAERRVRVSSAGFSGVRFEESDNDCEFVVGSSRFRCNHTLACFLSPTIAKFHFLDPTVNCYSVSSITDTDAFQSFLSICSGSELIIGSSNKAALSSLSRELGDYELFWLIENDDPDDCSEFSGENVAMERICGQT